MSRNNVLKQLWKAKFLVIEPLKFPPKTRNAPTVLNINASPSKNLESLNPLLERGVKEAACSERSVRARPCFLFCLQPPLSAVESAFLLRITAVTQFISSCTLKARTGTATHVSNIFTAMSQLIYCSYLAKTFRRNLQSKMKTIYPNSSH